MTVSKDDLITLLAQAEAKANQLQKENEQLASAFQDMLKAQDLEAQQLVELSEQLWAAQDALAAAESGRSEALAALQAMSGTISSIQNQVNEAQEAARQGVSGLEIEARLYEIKAVATDPLDDMLKAYNESLGNKNGDSE